MLGEHCGSEFAAKAERLLELASRKPAERCRNVAENKGNRKGKGKRERGKENRQNEKDIKKKGNNEMRKKGENKEKRGRKARKPLCFS